MRIPLVYNERSRLFIRALNEAIDKLEVAQRAVTHLPVHTADYLAVIDESPQQARLAAQEELMKMGDKIGVVVTNLQDCLRVLVARAITAQQGRG